MLGGRWVTVLGAWAEVDAWMQPFGDQPACASVLNRPADQEQRNDGRGAASRTEVAYS